MNSYESPRECADEWEDYIAWWWDVYYQGIDGLFEFIFLIFLLAAFIIYWTGCSLPFAIICFLLTPRHYIGYETPLILTSYACGFITMIIIGCLSKKENNEN